MKTTLYTIIFIFSAALLYSCHATSETQSSENQNLTAPMQQQDQENTQEKTRERDPEQTIERTGLAYDEVQKLNGYAEEKGALLCQMVRLQENAEQSLSDHDAQEFKTSIAALDQKISTLSLEIDTYCNTEDRQKYFRQILKQHTSGCE